MSWVINAVDFADKLMDLIRDQAEWSQATFGSDQTRSPMGALKHLAKEAVEAQEALAAGDAERLKVELADCYLLLLDACRRAKIKPMQLVEAAQEKMKVNRSRQWPVPTTDEPVEHIR